MGRPLSVVSMADPSPAPGEVVIDVAACGICGSDLHASDHLPLDGVVLGHEFCGTVADVGDGTSNWRVGDPVVGLSLATCGTCAACTSGRIRKCMAASMVGFERPGAFAEFVALPADALLALPPGLDDRHGALAEPLAVARHAVDRAGVQPGDDVVVLGAGPVGLAVTLWLAHLGARSIVVTDPADERRQAARSLGATAVVDPSGGVTAEAVADACGGAPRVAIECVGVPGLLDEAIGAVGVDGVVSVAGVCMATEPVTPIIAMVKELDLRFSFFYRRQDIEMALTEMAAGRLDPLPMISGATGLDELPARFEQLKTPTQDAAGCKVLVRPRQDSNLRPFA